MDFSKITLGELLSSSNEIIKRNAFSILKQKQKERDQWVKDWTKKEYNDYNNEFIKHG